MIAKVDLHTHTASSRDGRQSLQQLTEAARRKGLHAVAVTDHNFFQPLPAECNGILLIAGCEFSCTEGHIVGLFLEQPPQAFPAAAREAVAEIHRCGGIAVLAHPFQKPSRTEEELSFPLDAIETANGRAALKNPHAHQKAIAYAEKRALPALGGSDAHSPAEVGNAYTELAVDTLATDALKQAILQGSTAAILLRDTPKRMVGLSQLTSRRRAGGLKNLLIGLAYLMKCILRDLF